MRKIAMLVAAGSMVAIAAPASAQAFDDPFTGFRLEGLVGYDSSRPGSSNDIDNWDDFDRSMNDISYGVGVGYDMNMGGFVLGIEGEWMESEASREFDPSGFAGYGVSSINAGRDLYAGVRAGFPVGDTALVYAKGGYTNAHYNVVASTPTSDVQTKAKLDGWRLGAGAEMALTGNLFLKAEYRYSNYGSAVVEAPSGLESDRFDVDVDRHQGVVGLGVRF